jgi:hypothetical protein
MKNKTLISVGLGVLVSAGMLMLTGCRTWSGPASASFASVTIKNHTAQEIATITSQVFGADGYSGGARGTGELVFDKEASRATSMAREGLAAGFNGASAINRVRVQIVPLAGGIYRVQCKAYMVTGGSDPFFQDEVPLANVRSGPYQSLLNQVRDQLK